MCLKSIEEQGHEASLTKHAEKQWYVFYTAPRAEKVACKELENRGYEVFLPIMKTLRVWKNRQKKMVDMVLFPSYLFVNTERHNLYEVCQVPKVVTYIRCGNKPSLITEKEMEGIRLMLGLGANLTIENNLQVGDLVEVVLGPLAGHSGILVNQKGKTKFGLQLQAINHTMLIDINVASLKRRVEEVAV